MKKIKIIVLLTITFFYLSCKTEHKELTGSIAGIVKIYAEDGYFLPDATVKVSVENTAVSTESDNGGFYNLQNIPVGTYNLVFSSDKINTLTIRGINIVGGTEPYIAKDVLLCQKPISTISNLRTYTYSFGFYKGISGTISPPGSENNPKKIILFLKDDINVSRNNYAFIKEITSLTDTFAITEGELELDYYPEDTIYAVAYTKSFQPQHQSWQIGNYNMNCDEYNMNCEELIFSDTHSNILKFPVDNK